MTRVVCCIPSIGLSPHLYDLVRTLLDCDTSVRVYVNSSDAQLDRDRLSVHVGVIHMPGYSIYSEWNDAARWARDLGAYLLLVTDDVVITSQVPGELAAALDCRPDYGLISTDVGLTHESFAPSDVTAVSHAKNDRYAFATWCFIARPEAWQDVDPRYRIWYGDDDLIWKVNAADWQTGYLRGVGVTHHTSTTSRQLPWVAQAAHEDGVLWASLH